MLLHVAPCLWLDNDVSFFTYKEVLNKIGGDVAIWQGTSDSYQLLEINAALNSSFSSGLISLLHGHISFFQFPMSAWDYNSHQPRANGPSIFKGPQVLHPCSSLSGVGNLQLSWCGRMATPTKPWPMVNQQGHWFPTLSIRTWELCTHSQK